jgi:hypothetical protein
VLHVVDVAWAAPGTVATTVAMVAESIKNFRMFAFSVGIEKGRSNG